MVVSLEQSTGLFYQGQLTPFLCTVYVDSVACSLQLRIRELSFFTRRWGRLFVGGGARIFWGSQRGDQFWRPAITDRRPPPPGKNDSSLRPIAKQLILYGLSFFFSSSFFFSVLWVVLKTLREFAFL